MKRHELLLILVQKVIFVHDELYLSTESYIYPRRVTPSKVLSAISSISTAILRNEAEITTIWQGLKLAQKSMYKIQARTKPPTTSIAEKDCEITMAAKAKPGTRNWKGRSAICWQSRFKTSAIYKREGRAWP